MTLRKQAFSGARWTMISSLGRTALQLLQISILARLLTPHDFGLVALVTSVMAFLQIFADAGISNAIVSHRDISQDQLSSLYWLNVLTSTVIAALLALTAPFLAILYGQPNLQTLLYISGGTLITSSLSQQLRVVAQKDLRFAELAKIDLSSSAIGFLTAVVTAFNNVGVYSIVYGTLCTALSSTILVWWKLSGGWRPKSRLQIKEITKFLAFGAYMIGNNIANTFNSQIDIMLGGRLLGSQAIGLYSMPRDLNLRIAGVFNQIATNVGFPLMAKAQNDKPLLKQVYLQTMRMTASVNFPIYVLLALFAPEIVHILLGQKWEEAIPLLRIFAVWGGVRSTANPIGSLLMACGRADISFKWNLSLLVIIPPVIWVGSHFHVTGMAIAMTLIMIMLYWPNWFYQVRPLCGASFSEYTTQLLIPFTISVITGSISFIATLGITNEVFKLISVSIIGTIVYGYLSFSLNRAWIDAIFELIFKKRIAKHTA